MFTPILVVLCVLEELKNEMGLLGVEFFCQKFECRSQAARIFPQSVLAYLLKMLLGHIWQDGIVPALFFRERHHMPDSTDVVRFFIHLLEAISHRGFPLVEICHVSQGQKFSGRHRHHPP